MPNRSSTTTSADIIKIISNLINQSCDALKMDYIRSGSITNNLSNFEYNGEPDINIFLKKNPKILTKICNIASTLLRISCFQNRQITYSLLLGLIKNIVHLYIDFLQYFIAKRHRVDITGFLSFKPTFWKKRAAYDIRNKKHMTIPPRKEVLAKISPHLKKTLSKTWDK